MSSQVKSSSIRLASSGRKRLPTPPPSGSGGPLCEALLSSGLSLNEPRAPLPARSRDARRRGGLTHVIRRPRGPRAACCRVPAGARHFPYFFRTVSAQSSYGHLTVSSIHSTFNSLEFVWPCAFLGGRPGPRRPPRCSSARHLPCSIQRSGRETARLGHESPGCTISGVQGCGV